MTKSIVTVEPSPGEIPTGVTPLTVKETEAQRGEDV